MACKIRINIIIYIRRKTKCIALQKRALFKTAGSITLFKSLNVLIDSRGIIADWDSLTVFMP